MRIGTGIVFALLSLSAGAQLRGDACQAQIPRSLSRALAGAFHGYRAPLEYDNAPEDMKADLSQGGTGCLGVAIADFTGDGKKDYLIGLTSVKGVKGMVVIALPKKGGWNFETITSWAEDARYRQYVRAVKPGRYKRAKDLTAPLAPGEKQSMDCSNSGALVGAVQQTGIVYCYDHGRWSHVWVTD
ncbi:MAG TPA: hypothetical protein VGM15_01130 [Burkholderiaceae bacterium]